MFVQNVLYFVQDDFGGFLSLNFPVTERSNN